MSFNIKLVYLLVFAVVFLIGGGLAGYFLHPNGVAQETYQDTLNQIEVLTTNANTLEKDLQNVRDARDALQKNLTEVQETQQQQQDEIKVLQAQISSLNGTISEMNISLKTYEVDRTMLVQLREFFSDGSPFTPIPPGMTFHLMEDGSYSFLQFDGPPTQATQLRYIGTMITGVFCDNSTFQTLVKDGFVHFRAMNAPNEAAASGGRPGEAGFWMKFIALGEFEMPWGVVPPGVDKNYAPTVPPTCADQ